MQIARLFVDELPGPCAHVEHGEVRMCGEASNFLRAAIVRVDIELAVAIGAEIDRVVDPLRVYVVGASRGLRNLFDGVRRDVVQPDDGRRAAAIVLPLLESSRDGIVGDAFPVGRVRRARRVGNGELRLGSAFYRYGEKLGVSVRMTR